MKVDRVIELLAPISIKGSAEGLIGGINFDSRVLKPGDLFVALVGASADGHDFIEQVVELGVRHIVCERDSLDGREDICRILVKDSRKALATLASEFYGNPSRDLYLVGVTGTNGKTTVATLLYNLHLSLGYQAGLLSTIEVRVGKQVFPATHTTPDPIQINRLMREMVDAGCGYCFMEVSSHALDQCRTWGLEFNGGIFTNLTHDHLDYHGDFASYLKTKKSFFDELPQSAWALSNVDDKHGKVMLQNCRAQTSYYSLRRMSDFRCRINEMLLEGSSLEINGSELWVRLPGKFNATNILSAYGAALLSGHEQADVLQALSRLDHVKGRFETIRGEDERTGVVDYAHTPDALSSILESINDLSAEGSSVITVVGAGGNRDKEKRPRMAYIAAEASWRVILTSDNPRNEDPERILDEMMEGIPPQLKDRVLRISEREEAIRTACMLAGKGDIILVAGKGHENYQLIGGEKRQFDDYSILKQNLSKKV